MQPNAYQQNALEQLDRWLGALNQAKLKRAKASEALEAQGFTELKELRNYPLAAWEDLKEQSLLPGFPNGGEIEVPDHISRTADSGEPIPHVCLKVPTGGGKTLLGVAALERIKQETGLVLWIVPTKAIYEQTIRTFRTREHPYRQMLERISGGKVKLLEKQNHFIEQDIESYLCVMMLMLPAANRQKGKDFLKIFRDSGKYASFFPEQDDPSANQKLSEQHPDLEKNSSGDWIKQSLINTLKLIRPTVILDEAHKAYGKNNKNNREFVKSINRLNPRLVLELSATPKIGISNILVNISGAELRDEEMIKLPIKIHSFENSDWKHTLAETQGKLNELEKAARELKSQENRYVRPIALIRVQRTGREQREYQYVHSEDVRDYLIQNLSVPEDQICIQSSEQKQLAGEDLLSESSSVRWIITKDALKEGWDCSFAYILALLDNTTAPTAMTQMVGRVMRQPQARRIKPSGLLNQCYIYCYNKKVEDAVAGVKGGLENEGLTGLGDAIHGSGGRTESQTPVTVKRRRKVSKIFLPQVLHKAGNKWRPIDYDRDIMSAVNWNKINGGQAVDLDAQNIIQETKVTIDLQGQSEISQKRLDTEEQLSLDYFVRRLMDIIPNPWQAARVAEGFIRKHQKKHDDTQLLFNRIYLAEILRRRVKSHIDTNAEKVFRDKVGQNQIRFRLITDERLDYELNNKSFEVSVSYQERSLQGRAGRSIQKSLFEPVYERNFNSLEKDFAIYLDSRDAIYWWHRIAAQRACKQAYSLQGWRRQQVYPDFVACQKSNGRLLILETKGMHLKGNEDTTYKEKLLKALENIYETSLERGRIEIEGPSQVVLRMMFQNTWQEEMNSLLADEK